ncbi:hypothetical protein [Pseudomonas phage ZQG1]|nr:hypothetical protein [Pseudomonas phage ZQG1]
MKQVSVPEMMLATRTSRCTTGIANTLANLRIGANIDSDQQDIAAVVIAVIDELSYGRSSKNGEDLKAVVSQVVADYYQLLQADPDLATLPRFQKVDGRTPILLQRVSGQILTMRTIIDVTKTERELKAEIATKVLVS